MSWRSGAPAGWRRAERIVHWAMLVLGALTVVGVGIGAWLHAL